jgi:undecaprenyl pyrophosphate phosphatase UppP
VKVQNRNSSRRKGQTLVLTVPGLGAAAAGMLAYLLSGVNGREAVILSWIAMGPVVFGMFLHRRAHRRREWSAAWDAYLLASDEMSLQRKQQAGNQG